MLCYLPAFKSAYFFYCNLFGNLYFGNRFSKPINFIAMHTRRKFLIQGSLATTAVLALKPFNAIANLTGTGNSGAKLVFLHTADFDPRHEQQLIQYITTVKNNHTNAILLKAGQDTSQDE